MKASLQQQPMYCSRDHNYTSRLQEMVFAPISAGLTVVHIIFGRGTSPYVLEDKHLLTHLEHRHLWITFFEFCIQPFKSGYNCGLHLQLSRKITIVCHCLSSGCLCTVGRGISLLDGNLVTYKKVWKLKSLLPSSTGVNIGGVSEYLYAALSECLCVFWLLSMSS